MSTNQYPATGYGYQPPPPPRKRHTARNIILSLAAVIVALIVAGVATAAAQSPKAPSSSVSGAATGAGTGDYSPAPASTTPPPSPAASQYTVSQQQAIAAAQGYLQTEPGFSYAGLIGQLDSPDGSGFSAADATVAVNSIAPASDTSFWDTQAADAASNYMTTEPGWSACGLVQQLDSSAVQFTQGQAEYGAQSAGLGSC